MYAIELKDWSYEQIIAHARACAKRYKELEGEIAKALEDGETRYAHALRKAQEGYKHDIYRCRNLIRSRR